MAGRGRGRGRGLVLNSEILNHISGGAGETAANKKDFRGRNNSVSDIEEVVANLSLDIDEKQLKDLTRISEEICKSGEDIARLAKIIYEKCLKDRELAESGSFVAQKMSNLEADGVKFRSSLLGLVQADFKVKNEIRAESTSRFLGFFTFLCQIFCNVRLGNREPIKPLIGPILETCELVLDTENEKCDDDEFECISLQLQSVGKLIESIEPDKMTDFLDLVRRKIVMEKTPPRVRCTLLELIECYGRKWEPASNEVTRCYCDIMVETLAGLVV
ncbi:hypothetical protein LOTGIDRAFT_234154 [Lottia gigantea]|uniref:MIF4G domain-containing protein n=1 Tax=Lottia gigantea TaxID=225164 RepID=V4A450_LOTGI|nr:hypothetical protein LOTGIDRAFT_234154 [Lottia gigantea]ESO89770.1 hypothetical protein LOTGIDRAFT_234154 [Lottia gigantea]